MIIINNKGFTLIELLAVLVILGVVSAIMVPSVTSIINENKENNYNALTNNIKASAKSFISDNKYNITLSTNICTTDPNGTREITQIKVENLSGTDTIYQITDSKIEVATLINNDYLKGELTNPKNKNETMNTSTSYIKVLYDCKTKKYVYDDVILYWN